MTYAPLKRLIDCVAATVLLAVFAVPLFVIALCIWLSMGRPVLFKQSRAGLNGSPFKILKFRTMRNATDSFGELLPDEQRLTAFGRFLRASSLDELPELVNILKGDMSLVGPRPLLLDYLPYYDEKQRIRHDVRPGLTGWAQVHGRNTTSWEERLRLDAEYVKRASLLLDAEIIGKTILMVVRREGISAEGHATMPRFDDEMKKKRGGAEE
ncbi:sugar transferase [Tepidicaulis sp. LMO-SS28]|uniref:sugar transferase n=1 Tax=Tepidicaulis sp. LMO-SS28 TaxID=3447455 RepID=UPI003EDF945E